MIDVTLNTQMGKQLMTMVLGVKTFQAKIQKQNADIFKKGSEQVNQAKKETEMWSDISFDMTSKMIDKRFAGSQDFINSRGSSGNYTYKKSASKDDLNVDHILRQTMLKNRTRLDFVTSEHNKTLADKKIKASFKLSHLKNYI